LRKSPRFLFNHGIRVFLFGCIAAQKSNWKFDAEVVFVAAALHDLGLLEELEPSSLTFEKAGAEYARKYATQEAHLSEAKANVIAEAIALHTTTGQSSPVPEIAMVMIGAAVDLFGPGFLGDVPPEHIKSIVQEYPRAAFGKEFKNLLVAYGRRHPGSAGEGNWIGPWVTAADARGGLEKQFDASPWPE
jgi:hypothetical protein